MKDKNTLARVILWAVIVVILCGAFVGVLLRYRFEQANTEPAAPLAAADPTLENGSTGKVSAQEGVNNVADNESAAPDTFLDAADAQLPAASEAVQVAVSDIRKIEVEWLSGSVTVRRADGDSIEFFEDYQGEEKYRLRYSVENGTLHIQVCQSDDIRSIPAKALTLSLPDALYQELTFSVVSANLTLSDVRADELELDSICGDIELDRIGASELKIGMTSGSGNIHGQSLTVSELELDSVSNDADLEGAFDSVAANTISGSVKLTSSSLPKEIGVNTVTGNITLTLPKDSAFRYEFNTISGKLNDSLPDAVSGSDAAVEINTTSGDLTLRPLD